MTSVRRMALLTLFVSIAYHGCEKANQSMSNTASVAQQAAAVPSNPAHDQDRGTWGNPFQPGGIAVDNRIGKLTLNIGQGPDYPRELNASICFTNVGPGRKFFNPTFNRLLPLPAVLALYDEKNNFVMDFMEFIAGSRRGAGQNDWGFLDKGASAQVDWPVQRDTVFREMLRPGHHYRLQAIFLKLFIADPEAVGSAWMPTEGHTLSEPLVRSNVVELEIDAAGNWKLPDSR